MAEAEAKKVRKFLDDARKLRLSADGLEKKAIRLQARQQSRDAAQRISNRQGKVAVFLGAGASNSFGWPLTHQLLPLVLDGIIQDDLFEGWQINKPQENAADRALLGKALNALWPGLEFNHEYLLANKHR